MPRAIPQSETRQPTSDELDARIDMCRQLISAGHYDGEVKSKVATHFNLSPRTVERYLRRARDLMIKETGKPQIEHRAESLAFYQHVRKKHEEETRDRIRAQERIDKLLGLETPQRVEMSGPGGGPMEHDVVTMSRDEMIARVRALEAKALTDSLVALPGRPDATPIETNGDGHENGDDI